MAVSLVFYAWGEELYVFILIASIVINYSVGLGIDAAGGRNRLWWLWGGISGNLLFLGYFKYTGFFLENIGLANAAALTPALPIGISFFTFQALSYLIDLYYRRVNVQKNPLNLALYISLFPQLIAGPIVRYAEVEAEILERKTSRSDVAEGVQQFVRGLAKKTLVADPMGLVADRVFSIPEAGLTPETAWLGAICYSLQLYFDFSAYSDMAIGLGRIFGFKFPPNFNYPYRATSVTDFWRRWHMTLSRWFRDYLYIPLGGNRQSAARTYLNLWIVFLATGIWHGAAWTFIAWGAYHGLFLIVERLGLGRILARLPSALQHIYLLLAVICGWVMFRSESFGQATNFYKSMFQLQSGTMADFYPVGRYLDAYVLCIMAIGIVASVGFRPWCAAKIAATASPRIQRLSNEIWFWALFVAAIISVGAASYSPFIYFRF
ncbi:MBOAT family O-acyltransferase [Algirhabdus cladophorae]|uniref:MBOAT family O-acyltransferase n=1 Tax=Algirhabdus cladophorae TaxID=3377108 RepID=UPI003B849C82